MSQQTRSPAELLRQSQGTIDGITAACLVGLQLRLQRHDLAERQAIAITGLLITQVVTEIAADHEECLVVDQGAQQVAEPFIGTVAHHQGDELKFAQPVLQQG